jgi:hypothetical protein
MIASMSSTTEPRRGRSALPLGLVSILILAPFPDTTARAAEILKPAALRKAVQKIEERLLEADAALEDGKGGRAGNLLRLAGDELAAFLDGSGLEGLLEMMARARQAVGEPEMRGAREALVAIRAGMNPLSDYVVRRDAEVAYQAARRAADEGNDEAYAGALHALDAAVLAPLLMARVEAARSGIAAARAASAARRLEVARSGAAAAIAAIRGLRLAAALSQALFGLQIASEFIADGHALAARDQLRQAGRALRAALDAAPQDLRAELARAEETVMGVLDRLSRPDPGDPAALAGALEVVKSLRTAQQ